MDHDGADHPDSRGTDVPETSEPVAPVPVPSEGAAPEAPDLPEESRLYDIDSFDPDGSVIPRADVDPAELPQIAEVMAALGRLRTAEDELSQASLDYMELGATDMKALRLLIVAENAGTITTAASLAAHLKISSASTTKLLDRLEGAGHLARTRHPSDRRALAIRITEATRSAAMETVGAHQARRFHAAARLTPTERDVVIRFLDDMAALLDVRTAPWAQGTEADTADD